MNLGIAEVPSFKTYTTYLPLGIMHKVQCIEKEENLTASN